MEFRTDKRKRLESENMEYKSYYCNPSDDILIQKIINPIFKKSFTITGNERYKLPDPKSMFVESPWEIKKLQQIKSNLNEIKSKLNNYCFDKWHQHTCYRNKAKDVEWRVRKNFNPEFVTQAWFKFHEIVTKYPLVPKENIFSNNNKFVSVHLCEAPGAFITCLNHWLKTNLPTVFWDWLAMTFNPYYEGNSNTKMISDDRFIMHTLKNWFFGKDNSGDLMVLENLEALIEKSKTKGKINLVTADGSINCTSDPGEQERIVVSLHFCEVVAAIHMLEANGNFLLKIFTIFEHQSICLIYFLSCTFKKIHFYKPVTSKGGNSEVYVICLGFKGLNFVLPYLSVLKNEYGKNSTAAMFNENDIPESFIEQIISCAQLFKNHQCDVIEDNIATYNFTHSDDLIAKDNFQLKRIKKAVADKYMDDFPLQNLHIDLHIVGNLILKKKSHNWVVESSSESFSERQKIKELDPISRLLTYEKQFQFLELDSKSFIFKPRNYCIDICINAGRSYSRILSSRFCTVAISEIYNLLFEVIDIEKNTDLVLPSREKIDEYECKIKSLWDQKYKAIHFQYTTICNNHQTILHIKQIVNNLQKGDNLILFGFLLLTQFNIGLIYLLSHTFDCVEFIADKEIGCILTFKYFQNKQLIVQKINEIYDNAEEAASHNSTVLSIIHVLELYGSELFPIIVKLNNWIAKYFTESIALVCKKNHQSNLEKLST